MTCDELQKIVRDCGIVGAGGAGFPTYKKLDERARTIIVNCAECEPLLKVHKQLLSVHTDEILGALAQIALTLGVSDTVIAVKSSSEKVIEILKGKIAGKDGVRLHIVPDVYPSGDEMILTYEVTGSVVRPAQLPITVGALVLNVETVYNISCAIKGIPVTHKYLTVSGEVAKPVTLHVPVGMKISEVIAAAGGVTVDNPAYIAGGPMMGRLTTPESTVTKTTNGILVLDAEHPLIIKSTTSTSTDMKRAQAACCQCSYCTDMCPRQLIGHPVNPNKFMLCASNSDSRNSEVYLNALYCSGCGLCEMYSCPQGLSPRRLLFALRGGIKEAGVSAPVYNFEPVVSEMRDSRRVPMSRLKARLGITRYDKLHAPLTEAELPVNRVDIGLRQSIGAPAKPVVSVGDTVSKGQLIAEFEENLLSVNLHASISGRVTAITDGRITIEV